MNYDTGKEIDEDAILRNVRMDLKGEFLSSEYLPHLPDDIEKELFLAGMRGWSYSYKAHELKHFKKSSRVRFFVCARLLKSLRHVLDQYEYFFFVDCNYNRELQRGKFDRILSITHDQWEKESLEPDEEDESE